MKNDKEKHYCWNCHTVEILEPVGCCNGQDCGCMNMPIFPPFCSDECQEKYFKRQEKKA